MDKKIKGNYKISEEFYKRLNIDVNNSLDILSTIPISIHCWQGDDLIGFEKGARGLNSGGILTTGNYPGRVRNIKELQSDIEKAFSLIPGKKKLSLHAIYGDFGNKRIDRDEIEPKHFVNWIDWAKKMNTGLDFNPTFFSHSKAESGYTLANKDKDIRDFWIEHLKRSREISNFIGEQLNTCCINNIWIPDGEKDKTANKLYYREILIDSLNRGLEKDFPEENMKDSLESKLFGIGSESFVVGSHEFYLSYALKNNKMVTFDTGHFHPTELVSDKITAVLPFISGILLHISRGVRWDSDHVPILSEELISIMSEIVRSDAFNKIFIGTDFFDASINRVGAWVIGVRTVVKALLYALLEPTKQLQKYEFENKKFERLALFEALKAAPFEYVWNYYLNVNNIPSDLEIIQEVQKYENDVLKKKKGFILKLQNFKKIDIEIKNKFLKLKKNEPEKFNKRLKLSWSNWVFGMELLEASLDRLKKYNIDYIELHGNRYGDDLGYKASSVKKILQDSDIKVSGICGMFSAESELSSNSPAVRQRAIDYIKRNLELGKDLDAKYFLIVPGAVGRPDPYDDMEFERSVETLSIVADEFRQAGIRGAVEPIRSAEVSFCHTFEDVKKYIKAVKTLGVRHINGDLYHMLVEESHIGRAVCDAEGMLTNIHVADTNRGALGEGFIDIDTVIMSLYIIGYNNDESAFVTPEPLGPGGDPYPAMYGKPDTKKLDRLVKKTAEYFREREEELLSL